MSIQVHRKLRLVPIERKQPQRQLLARRIARRSTPKRIIALRRKEAPPWPPR